MLSGTPKGSPRGHRLEGDDGVLEGADADGVLPAQLRRVGEADEAVPADAVEHLHVVQVEVDRMGVDAVMGDLPDLDFVRVDDLRGWVGVVLHDEVHLPGAGIGQLQAEGGLHPAVVVEGLSLLVLDRLGLHGDRLDVPGLRVEEADLLVVDPRNPPVGIGGGEGVAGL